jgi:hypothetical protein
MLLGRGEPEIYRFVQDMSVDDSRAVVMNAGTRSVASELHRIEIAGRCLTVNLAS